MNFILRSKMYSVFHEASALFYRQIFLRIRFNKIWQDRRSRDYNYNVRAILILPYLFGSYFSNNVAFVRVNSTVLTVFINMLHMCGVYFPLFNFLR